MSISELQMGLIGAGGAVVVGIFALNKWQERKHRKAEAPVADEPPTLQEPVFGSSAEPVPARVEPIMDEPMPELAPGEFYIASVHGSIRTPEVEPPRKGGHLVLVFGQDEQGRWRFNNPSGIGAAQQRDVRLSPETFSRFHADRGILIPL